MRFYNKFNVNPTKGLLDSNNVQSKYCTIYSFDDEENNMKRKNQFSSFGNLCLKLSILAVIIIVNVCCSFESNGISNVNLIKNEYSRILSETEKSEKLTGENKNGNDGETEVSTFDGSDGMGHNYDNNIWSAFNEVFGKRELPPKKPKKPHPLKNKWESLDCQSKYDGSSVCNLISAIKSTFGGVDEHLFQTCPDIFDNLLKRSTWDLLELDFYETELSSYLTVPHDLTLNEKILTLNSVFNNVEDLSNLWSDIMKHEEQKFNFLRYRLYNYYYGLKNRSRVSREYSEKIWNECEKTLKSLHENHERSIFDLFHKWINGRTHELSEFKVLVVAGRYSWRSLLKTGERECKKFMDKHYNGKIVLRV
ncbi:exported protein (PHISTb) [Plasmodium gaboni]|uniref:Exported protein (PHISTb) n=1 Tax=Plasmodium gaboni TaxID=647221 RepID=A0A151LME0_9APIC|nr:exported protein (PHISTb) [Plasmodium gaboni]KYO00344.1 exported protein (PHISTb) [Plasmodium gaboni]